MFLCFLISILILSSCTSKEERIIEDFFDSTGFETDIYVKLGEINTTIEQKIGIFRVGKDGLEIKFINNLGTIIFSIEDNKIYYDSFAEKYYTTDDLSSGITLVISSTKESNIPNVKDYIININFEYNIINFEIDLKEMVLSELTESEKEQISNAIDIKSIKCSAKVENDKVKEFSMNIDPFLSLIDTNGMFSSYDIDLIMKEITYDSKIEVTPGLKHYTYEYKSNEDFLNFILSKFNQENDSNNNNSNNNNNQPTYQMGWYQTYYTLEQGSNEFLIDGYLSSSNYGTILFTICKITYSPNLDLTKTGETVYEISVTYQNCTVKGEITINVVGVSDVLTTEKVIDKGISKIFKWDNYMFVCDTVNMYKYNLDTKLIEGSVNLKCQANSIYVRDGYLYVASNYISIDDYYEDDNYRGTITKIKLDDFTIDKQVDVNCYPYSIFVDNRGDIIVGKGRDQWINYSKIDLETGNIIDLFQGYHQDYLIYSEEKDAFLSITQSISSDNSWYKYYENQGYNNHEYKSGCSINSLSYVYKNGEVLIESSYWSNRIYVSKFDSDINDYVGKEFTIPSFDIRFTKFVSTYEDNKVYFVGTPESGNVGVSGVIDLETENVSCSYIKLKTLNVDSIHVYNDLLYVAYLDSKILDVFN